MQVQTQGAATTVLVVSVVKVVWAGGSGQALGEAAGEAGGEIPCSVFSQMQKCSHSPRMSLEHGAFEAQLIIWGKQCSNQRMYYFGGVKEKYPAATAEFQVRFTATKPLMLQTTQLAVHGW